MMWN